MLEGSESSLQALELSCGTSPAHGTALTGRHCGAASRGTAGAVSGAFAPYPPRPTMI